MINIFTKGVAPPTYSRSAGCRSFGGVISKGVAPPTYSRSAGYRSFGGVISRVCRKNKVSEGINKSVRVKDCNKKRIFKIGGLLMFSLLFIYSAGGAATSQKRWDAVTHDKTNFPLIGKHRTLSCGECHLKGVMQGTPTDCEACHWYRKQDDPYRLQLGIHCEECHTPVNWKILKPNSWNHEQETGLRLAGIHQTLDCYRCHQERVFYGQGRDCIDCHRGDYERAVEPNHVLGQFQTDCRLCHNMLTWEGARFDHLTFPLNGMHPAAACSDCHQNNQYWGISTECVSCHLVEYNNTVNPNHIQAGYPTDCEICHGNSAVTWYGARVDHERFWVLKGAHIGLDCNRCHFRGYRISSDCITCHVDDYNNTREPNHVEAGFHTDCEYCHLVESTTWTQVIFAHQFPIFSGNHQHLSCTDCHRTANFFEFSCIDCHEHSQIEMDNKHKDVGGYVYNSQACYSCHPTGTK